MARSLDGAETMGRAPKLDHVRDSFLASLGSAEALYEDVEGVAAVRPAPVGLPFM